MNNQKQLFRPYYVIPTIIDKRVWNSLCRNTNPAIVEYLETHPEQIVWKKLSLNSAACDLLKTQNIDNLDLFNLCKNSNAWSLIEPQLELINNHEFADDYWYELSKNESAIYWILENTDKINWKSLCANTHTKAVELLIQHPDRIDWQTFCSNPNPVAVRYMTQNLDQLLDKHECWENMCKNENPDAVALIAQIIDQLLEQGGTQILVNSSALHLIESKIQTHQIDWILLAHNHNYKALNYLQKFVNKKQVTYASGGAYRSGSLLLALCENPYALGLLFKYDYDAMRNNMAPFTEELASYVFNPRRLERLCNKYNLTFEELNDLL